MSQLTSQDRMKQGSENKCLVGKSTVSHTDRRTQRQKWCQKCSWVVCFCFAGSETYSGYLCAIRQHQNDNQSNAVHAWTIDSVLRGRLFCMFVPSGVRFIFCIWSASTFKSWFDRFKLKIFKLRRDSRTVDFSYSDKATLCAVMQFPYLLSKAKSSKMHEIRLTLKHSTATSGRQRDIERLSSSSSLYSIKLISFKLSPGLSK